MRKYTFKLEKIWTFVDKDKRDFEGMGEGIVWSWLGGKRRAFEGEGEFCCRPRGWGWLIWVWGWVLLHAEGLRVTNLGVWVRVFELWESVWETERLRVFKWGIWKWLRVYSVQISSLINLISAWLNLVHVENLSTKGYWQTPKIEF